MKNLVDLTEKKILVTGASSGIGRAVCILCSELGADVVMVARNSERLQETLSMMQPGKHLLLEADLAQLENIEALVPKMVEDGVKLDGFVHAAGITKSMSIRNASYVEAEELMKINYFAYIELLRHICKKKICNSGLSVVGLSSNSIDRGTSTGLYAGTKAAMEASSHVFRYELRKKGIRINMVRPGLTRTPMTSDYFEEHSPEELSQIFPLGITEAADVANAICFLLSDASSKITDQVIRIESGLR